MEHRHPLADGIALSLGFFLTGQPVEGRLQRGERPIDVVLLTQRFSQQLGEERELGCLGGQGAQQLDRIRQTSDSPVRERKILAHPQIARPLGQSTFQRHRRFGNLPDSQQTLTLKHENRQVVRGIRCSGRELLRGQLPGL